MNGENILFTWLLPLLLVVVVRCAAGAIGCVNDYREDKRRKRLAEAQGLLCSPWEATDRVAETIEDFIDRSCSMLRHLEGQRRNASLAADAGGEQC
jgi:hypothetical protein